MSLIAVCAWSSWLQPSTAILNLRGRSLAHGARRHMRVIAWVYGVTSNASVGLTPANGQPVMLRTVLPHASIVVDPAASSLAIAPGMLSSLTKWNCRFWRVVTWPMPKRVYSRAMPALARSWAALMIPPGNLVRSMFTSVCRCPYTPRVRRNWRNSSRTARRARTARARR
jgi:hypothetical protein